MPTTACLLGLWLLPVSFSAEPAPFTPTAAYTLRELHGFQVRIHPAAIEQADDLAVGLEELSTQLQQIRRVVPAGPLAELVKTPIWIEWDKRPGGAAEFHPSAEWLKDNGYNPDKVRSVEINNLRNFIDWSRKTQPCMVLHELAHAYHHRVLSRDDKLVLAAYEQAKSGQSYESVRHVDGQQRRHYALTDDAEYFAELTEAYFGKNDFYPFTQAELREHDPTGYAMCRKLWGEPVAR